MKQQIIFLIAISFGWNLNAQVRQVNVHDPVAIKAEGKYYLFNTGRGIASWVSDDFINWNYLQRVFPEAPIWAKDQVPGFDGNIWAPDIFYHNGTYYLYYSISSFASNLSCIGLVTNTSLDPANLNYKWQDHGPIIKSVPGRDMWNAIDPNLIFDEQQQPWLAFGSFWEGIKLVKMSSDLKSVAQPEEWHTIASRERDFSLDETDPGNAAIEAPFIFKKANYFYLFVSFDLCCRGERSTYNVRVGRSTSLIGPYIDKDGIPMRQGGGTVLIGPDDEYYGQGHNAVYTFDEKDYFICHGYQKAENGRSKLVIHELSWDEDGWPVLMNK